MKNIFWAVILVVGGCNYLTEEQQYINYINDPENKITQQIRIGQTQATVKWLPQNYMKLMNKKRGSDLLNGSGNEFYYFDIRFDKAKIEEMAKEKTLYLDFDMQKDFVLLIGQDSILPAICQKIENGVAGSYQYMLAFQKTNKQNSDTDFTVVYNDKIFGTGTLAFVYKQNDIQKIPKLKGEKIK